MSAEVYGLAPGEFIPANDFTASKTDKGGWRATQSFTYIRSSLSDATFRNKFAGGVRAVDLDPNLDAYWSRLYLESVVVRHEGPWGVISVNYAGYAGYETDSNGQEPQPVTPVFTLTGTLTERSIMMHPSVVALSQTNRFVIQGVLDGLYIWDPVNSKIRVVHGDNVENIEDYNEFALQPTAGDATDWVVEASVGEPTYESASFTWEAVWESELPLPVSKINNLGKVDTPWGSPIVPAGTRDWKLGDASSERRGELYRHRLAWDLSEDGGWNATRYDY
jgi:hypothetical protein